MKHATFFFRHLTVLIIGSILCLRASAGDLNRIDNNGLRQGYWIVSGAMCGDAAYKADSKVEEGEYRDSKKEGIWKRYWPNGRLRSEINYLQGRPSGYYTLFYENGVMEESGNWTNNKNTGDFRRYHSNGNLQQHFQFNESGKRQGWQKYYHENGKLELEVNLVNGQEHGTSKRYLSDGTLAEEKSYEKGVVQPGSVKIYKQTQPAAAPEADPYDKSIGKESVVVKDKVNKADTFKPDGYNVLYDINGHITQSGEFRKGKLFNGKWYRYNSNGVLIRIEIYRSGKYTGNGVISEEDL